MFWGRCEIHVDDKWRLNFPRYIGKQLENFVILKDGEDCLEIHKPSSVISEEDAPFVFLQEVKTNSPNKGKRVTIPLILRKSNSFYFGRKVILAGKGLYLEIWPQLDAS